jgi:hypothetical protein
VRRVTSPSGPLRWQDASHGACGSPEAPRS